MKLSISLPAFWVLVFIQTHVVGQLTSKLSADLEAIAKMMLGSFSSQKQARADSSYFDVRLQVSRIWPSRKDAIWLYIEQAMAGDLEKPYRQRVYKLSESGANAFQSEIFTLKNPERFVGLGRKSAAAIPVEEDLTEKKGCTEFLEKKGAEYCGGTRGKDCLSELKGARYATTSILLKPGELQSWDRGFDAEGRQVWGALKGAYIFLKEN